MASIKSASAAKSRSLTASMLLAIEPLNPRASPLFFGSDWIDEPASAPAPNGERLFRSNQSKIRSISRSNE